MLQESEHMLDACLGEENLLDHQIMLKPLTVLLIHLAIHLGGPEECEPEMKEINSLRQENFLQSLRLE